MDEKTLVEEVGTHSEGAEAVSPDLLDRMDAWWRAANDLVGWRCGGARSADRGHTAADF